MKVDKIEESDKARVTLAQGKVDDREFVISIFVDGTGVIFEFHDNDEKYLLLTDDIVIEILKEAAKK